MTDLSSPTPPEAIFKHMPPPGRPLIERLLLWLAICSALMLGIAVHALIDKTGPLANLKVLLITVSGGLAAYGVNRFAVLKGAPLFAIGFKLAGALSIAGILLVGSGMAIGTFSGLTLEAVETRQLEEHGQTLQSFVTATDRDALDAAKSVPAIEVVESEFSDLAACEYRRSCFSGIGYGGRGPVTRALETAAGKAGVVGQAFTDGAQDRTKLLDALNTLSDSYLESLADSSLSKDERRSVLQALHGKIEQTSSMLAQALPLGVLASYSEELRKGVSIDGDSTTTQKLNKLFEGQADALEDALPSVHKDAADLTPFPPRPGMMDALDYIGDFAALAAIIAVAELSLPITLFILTWLSLAWELERRGASGTRQRSETDEHGFGDLLDPPPVDETDGEETGPAPKPAKRGPGRPRKSA